MSARLLIVPGLGDSGPGHWQSHVERAHAGAVRVHQSDWDAPDVGRWSDAVVRALPARPDGAILVAHSFGCFAAARAIRTNPRRIRAALLVAPPDPRRLGASASLPRTLLDPPAIVIASANDPWCDLEVARRLAKRWGAQFLSIGQAGHINVDAGFGRWPLGERLVETLLRVYGTAARPRIAPPPNSFTHHPGPTP